MGALVKDHMLFSLITICLIRNIISFKRKKVLLGKMSIRNP